MELVGPLMAGALYARVSRTAPYIVGIATVLLTLALLMPVRTGRVTESTETA
jgi:hypothetical protein